MPSTAARAGLASGGHREWVGTFWPRFPFGIFKTAERANRQGGELFLGTVKGQKGQPCVQSKRITAPPDKSTRVVQVVNSLVRSHTSSVPEMASHSSSQPSLEMCRMLT